MYRISLKCQLGETLNSFTVFTHVDVVSMCVLFFRNIAQDSAAIQHILLPLPFARARLNVDLLLNAYQ